MGCVSSLRRDASCHVAAHRDAPHAHPVGSSFACSSVVAGAGKELASASEKQPTSDSPLRRELPGEVAQCDLNFSVTLWPIVWAHTGRTISTRRLQSAHLSGAAVCFLCPHPFSLT